MILALIVGLLWQELRIAVVVPQVVGIVDPGSQMGEALVFFLIEEVQKPYGDYPTWSIVTGWSFVFLPLLLGFWLNKSCAQWERNRV